MGALVILQRTFIHEDDYTAIQTLGEEYTDVWQHSFYERVPSYRARVALILLPTLPSYILARWGSLLANLEPRIAVFLRVLPTITEVASEINLAIFYLRGTYYDISKRILRIRHVCSASINRVFKIFFLADQVLFIAIITPRKSPYTTSVIFATWDTPRHPPSLSSNNFPSKHSCATIS